MKKFTIRKKVLSTEEIEQYNAWNPGYIATGDTILYEYTDYYGLPGCEELVIFKAADRKHNYTPYMSARQTSKYIILARYSSYIKLTHNGKVISLDAEDNNTAN